MQPNAIIKDKTKIRIGVVGYGKIAANHFNAIKELPDEFELACVCDNHPATLQQAVSTLKVEGYNDIASMLNANNGLDIITLCSPSGLHAKQTIQIAQSGKHVITEKPMATRWSDGVDMVKVCDEENVRLFVIKQVRYLPVIQLLKNAIKWQRFGRIYLANLNVFWTRPQTYYDQSKWRGTWEFDGGAFMNQASHHIDLLHWLLGPIQNVHAMMSTLAMNIETEDTGVINIRWRSGALGSMNVTMLTYPKNLETSLTILGEKGSVKIGGVSANQLLHWEFDGAHEQDELAAQLKNPPQLPPHFGHMRYYQNVSKTLRGEEQAETDGREGLRTLEILSAAYLSARDNAQVSLPLIY
jgi:UDP-N-acetyl-2-amino-2-deoxyglucuronate dehydrogenase